MLRTFIAIEIAAPVIARLTAAQAELRRSGASVRWTAATAMHLTLQFLGDVRAEDTPALSAELVAAAEGIAPFRVAVRGVGAFPNAERPRIVWAGVEPAPPLMELSRRLDERLRDFDVKHEDRAYTPHLTLGRVKDERQAGALTRAIAAQAEAEFGVSPVREVVFFMSELTPAGPVHAALSRAPLRPS